MYYQWVERKIFGEYLEKVYVNQSTERQMRLLKKILHRGKLWLRFIALTGNIVNYPAKILVTYPFNWWLKVKQLTEYDFSTKHEYGTTSGSVVVHQHFKSDENVLKLI